MKEENNQGDSVKSFRFWFMLFGLMTIVVVVFFQGLTIASAHSLAGMVLMRQMSLVVKQEKDKKNLLFELETLKERVDLIDPYSKDE